MKIINTKISDVKIIEPKIFADDRGFFMETFKDDWFKKNISSINFVQENHSKSMKGILRGLHYQVKNAQGKLVRVIAGEVYDVAVDMRKSSLTFGKSVGVRISSKNHLQLWVPPGFAHGFYVISEYAEFVYKCTDYYAPEYERSLLWNDKDLKIKWPLQNGTTPLLSDKDKNGNNFKDADFYD